jgi:hypothetical protein
MKQVHSKIIQYSIYLIVNKNIIKKLVHCDCNHVLVKYISTVDSVLRSQIYGSVSLYK